MTLPHRRSPLPISLLLVALAVVSARLPFVEDRAAPSVRDCLADLAAKSFDDTPILYVTDTATIDHLPTTDERPRSYHNLDGTSRLHEWNESYYYTNHVIVGADPRALLDRYRNTTLFNAKYTVRGRTIVYAPIDDDALDATVKHFWTHYFVQLLVVDATRDIRYAYPYAEGTRCGATVRYVRYGNCADATPEIAWEPYPRALSGCTLNAITFGLHIKMPYLDDANLNAPVTGILNRPLRALKRLYGVAVNYTVANDRDQNAYPQFGTPYLYERMYATRAYDLIVVEPFRLPHTGFYYESSEIVLFERKVWMSPKPRPLSKITILARLFRRDIWICWLVTLVVVTAATWAVARTPVERAFFHVYGVAVGAASPLTATFAPSGRLLFAFYAIYALHIACFFQGQLSSLLTSPAYELPIDSFERLAASNLTIVFYYKVNRDTFVDSLNRHVQSMRNRTLLVVTDDYNPPERVFRQGNHSASGFAFNSNITEAHKKQIVFFADSVLYSFEATYTARKGYPLLQTLNRVIVRIRESGLVYKWLTDLRKIAFIADDEQTTVVLSFDHVQAAFVLLAAGLAIGCATFAAELIAASERFGRFKARLRRSNAFKRSARV